MRIAIDAPAIRSLSANEKMVYRFLRDGLTPTEIAHRMHIPVGKGGYVNQTCELPGESIMGIITSIREKGWDIPTDNKEEAEMPIVKLSEEDKRNIVTANQAGASVTELAAKYHIAKGTVYNIVSEWKKKGDTALNGETEVETKEEPETAATESGSEQETCHDIPADIVSPSGENVKPRIVIPNAVIEACWAEIDHLNNEIAKEQAAIDDWKSQIADINSFLELAKGGAAV